MGNSINPRIALPIDTAMQQHFVDKLLNQFQIATQNFIKIEVSRRDWLAHLPFTA